MAKLPRKTQKVFAQGSSNNGVFGSAADGTKVTTTDISTIQSKAAFNTGWIDATISAQRLPTLEEEQGLHFMTTQQIAYILQEGVAEYDAGTQYHMNSVVKQVSTYKLYGSVVDNNTGNPLTDNTKWKLLTDLDGTNGQSLATNGYKTFPGGLIIQWGKTAAFNNGAGLTINFPIPFPAACLNVMGTVADFSGNTTNTVTETTLVNIIDNTSFQIKRGGLITLPAFWIAIGF